MYLCEVLTLICLGTSDVHGAHGAPSIILLVDIMLTYLKLLLSFGMAR